MVALETRPGQAAFHKKLMLHTRCFEVGVKMKIHGSVGGSDMKESACNAGDPSSVPGLGRFSGEGNGSPL